MMAGPGIATCDRELSLGPVPEWVHLFPPGRMVARDGRVFELADAEAVVAAFRQGGIDLPVDYEHQNDRPAAKHSGPVPAAGWIKELASRADGLWGRVEWTAKARALIGNREYRFLSPAFFYDAATKTVTRLKGAGLVHNPALHLTALASEETDMDTPDLRTVIAEALGLSPETPDAEIVAAFRAAMERLGAVAGKRGVATMAELVSAAATPDPAKYVPIAAVQDMLRTRGTERVATAEARVTEKVAGALRDGVITPGMKDWATALCRTDEASFDHFVAETGPVFAHFGKRVTPVGQPPGRAAATSAEEEALCAQLGLKPGSLAD
jgi:phage I-like protein